jgi:hypothetical protein
MKYDSVAITTQPVMKVAVIVRKVNGSVTQNNFLLSWECGDKWVSSLSSDRPSFWQWLCDVICRLSMELK